MSDRKGHINKDSDVTSVYLSGQLGSPEENYDLVNFLYTVEYASTKSIIIHINSSGGTLKTALQICNAIQACDVEVTTAIDVEASSAASMIFLAGEKKIVTPASFMLVHNCRSNTSGKNGQQLSRIEFNNKWFKNVMHDYYDGFLTDFEINEVLSDKDLWLDSNEIISRLRNLNENVKSFI
jgi:ATP-dependent protease ClpP protease subunit